MDPGDSVRLASPEHPTPLPAVLRAATDPTRILSGCQFDYGKAYFHCRKFILSLKV
jgi:hypothetical protein